MKDEISIRFCKKKRDVGQKSLSKIFWNRNWYVIFVIMLNNINQTEVDMLEMGVKRLLIFLIFDLFIVFVINFQNNYHL